MGDGGGCAFCKLSSLHFSSFLFFFFFFSFLLKKIHPQSVWCSFGMAGEWSRVVYPVKQKERFYVFIFFIDVRFYLRLSL
jgi:hypothetical protein